MSTLSTVSTGNQKDGAVNEELLRTMSIDDICEMYDIDTVHVINLMLDDRLVTMEELMQEEEDA